MEKFGSVFFIMLMHLSVMSGAPIVQSTMPPSLSFMSALEQMAKNGYLSENENQDRLAKTIKSISPAIEKFQRFASINATKNMAELSFVFSVVLLQLSVNSGVSINESALSPLVSYISDLEHPIKIQEHQITNGYSSENETQNNSASTNESFSFEPIELSYKLLAMPEVSDEKTLPNCQFDEFSSEERKEMLKVINGDDEVQSRQTGIEEKIYWPNASTLSYKILNTASKTNNINSDDIKSIIATSFEDWSKVISLNFKFTTSDSDINIGFFDIKKNTNHSTDTFALSFYPRKGKLFFEDSKKWSHEMDDDANLRQVATHEIGHILGLDHSNVVNAVMYTKYPKYDPNFLLDIDDITRIQKIYGSSSKKPACRYTDKSSDSKRRKRFLNTGRRWSKNSLTYRIHNFPKNTNIKSISEIDTIFANSFQDWSEIIPLNFSSTTSDADITISFETEPFEPRYCSKKGMIVAIVHYPPNCKLIFDDFQNWTDKIKDDLNLRQTATHEIGHILGLGHSDVEKAVMYSYYSDYNPKFALDKDDINGIQDLYGNKTSPKDLTNGCNEKRYFRRNYDAVTIFLTLLIFIFVY